MAPRLILFDIDGTLIRTKGAGVQAFARTFAALFQTQGGTEAIAFAGRTDPSIVREFFAHHQIPPTADNFRFFFEHYVFWLDYLLRKTDGEICAGVWNFLHRLAARPDPPVLGLLTGNIRLGAEIKLRHFYLWEHFRLGAFGDDHEDRNQLAAIALERGRQCLGAGLSPDEVIVVGDTPHDIACAQAIQARSLAVCTGGATADQLQTHRPTWLVADLHAAPAAVFGD